MRKIKWFGLLLLVMFFMASCNFIAGKNQKKFSIEYELNGGQWKEGFEVPDSYAEGDEILLPGENDISLDGYVFEGWYEYSDLKGSVSTYVTEEDSGDKKYYASWVEDKEDRLLLNLLFDLFLAEHPTTYPVDLPDGTDGTADTYSRYVTFGTWPQTKLIDASITVDEKKSCLVGMFTYYRGSDNEWYAKMNGNYYKVEPIKWRVLNPDESGNKILLAEKILATCAFYDYENSNRYYVDHDVYPTDYKYSRIRAFLNGLKYDKKASDGDYEAVYTFRKKGFLQTAFTEAEQNAIADTKLVDDWHSATPADYLGNSGNKWDHWCKSEYLVSNVTVKDKIFLLSEREATTAAYGFGQCSDELYYFEDDDCTRFRYGTDFAVDCGLLSYPNGLADWWLRSPSRDNFVRLVETSGRTDEDENICRGDIGVVPALCIKK